MTADHPYLTLESSGDERIPLKDSMTLGRTPGNDLVFSDAGCSGRHATIRRDRSGWVIEDLGSTNGTWVNGEWIKEPCPLHEGDVIQLGAQVLRVHGLASDPRCVRCGSTHPPSAAFCPSCGLPLKASSPGGTIVMPPPKAPPKVSEQLGTPPPDPGPPAPLPSVRRSGQRRGVIVAIALGLTLITAATAVILWFRWKAPAGTAAAGKMDAQPKPPAPPGLALLGEAVVFRMSASGSQLREAIDRCDGKEALGFITSSKLYQDAPAVWSYFFSGAVVLGGCLESPRPVIAYYNPFLDGVLLTQWEQHDGKGRLRVADLRIGSRMARQTTANPNLAWWLAELSKRPAPAGLQEQYGAFAKAFERDFPAASKAVANLQPGPDVTMIRTILERQAVSSFTNLARFQTPGSPVFQPRLAALKKALRAGDAASLGAMMPANNPMKAEALAAQPSWIRQEAVPVYALAGTSRTLVLLAPSRAPRYCLLASWPQPAGLQMDVLVPFDLDGTDLPLLKNAGTQVNP